MRALTALLVLLLSLASLAGEAKADKRVALVIGNSDYKLVSRLTNPANDATAVAKLLEASGFEIVDARRDLTGNEMRRAIREFTAKTRDADMAVVYYAGHGIEMDGVNYLVPVDAVFAHDIDVEDEAIALDRIVRILEPVKRLRLVILDACRDAPFVRTMKRMSSTRSIGRGLARVEPPSTDTLIAFAAKAGSTAADGDGQHSPFTAALLKNLAEPGLDVRIAFGRIRDEVLKSTGNRQEPFVYGSLGGATVSLVPLPAKPVVVAPPPVDPMVVVRRDYELASQVGTKQAWDYFLAVHGTGFYANLARAHRDKIEAGERAARLAEEVKAAADARAAAQAKAAAETKAAAEAQAVADAKRLADAKAAAEAKARTDAQAAESKRIADAATQAEREARARAEAQSRAEAAAEAEAEAAARSRAEAEARARADAAAKEKEKAQTEATKPAEPIVIAALPPEQPIKPPALAVPDIGETTRRLQAELRRVGCYPGTISGNWDGSSQSALGLFNKHAGAKLDVKLASLDSLDVIKAKPNRVCPLQCQRGFKAEKDACVRITCPRGQTLRDDGACKAPDKSRNAARSDPKQATDPKQGADQKPAAAKPASGGQVVCSHNSGCQAVKPGCRSVLIQPGYNQRDPVYHIQCDR